MTIVAILLSHSSQYTHKVSGVKQLKAPLVKGELNTNPAFTVQKHPDRTGLDGLADGCLRRNVPADNAGEPG